VSDFCTIGDIFDRVRRQCLCIQIEEQVVCDGVRKNRPKSAKTAKSSHYT